MESDFQYEVNANAAAMSTATMTPIGPKPMATLNARPITAMSATNAAIRSAERRLLEVTWSYSGPALSELDPRHGTGVLGCVEELPFLELAGPGHDECRELLDGGVVAAHLVVVELPRVGDAILC